MSREEVLVPILFRHNGGSTQQCKESGYILLLRFIYLRLKNNAVNYSESMSRRIVLHFLGGTASNREKAVK